MTSARPSPESSIFRPAITLIPSPGLALLVGLIMLASGPLADAGYTNPNSTVFLPTYTGPQNTDLEVKYVDVTYNAPLNDLVFTATLNGPVGATPGVTYVFGLNRGMGTARFTAGNPSIGQNIFFDSVLILNAAGTGQFNDFITPANSTAIGSGITISGDTITAVLSASLFPSEGFALSQYTYNLWPRLGTGSNTQISQFVPSNMNIPFSTPEPSSLVLMALGGLPALALALRNRSRVR